MSQIGSKGVTLGDVLRQVADALDAADLVYGHGTDNAWDEAVFLCLSALKLPLDSTDVVLNRIVNESQRTTIEQWLAERIELRKPLPYITGEAWFAGKPYRVNSEVLIPRSPLAEVLQAQGRPWLHSPAQRILDLCTGSGCIGIEAAHQFPNAVVDLVDISSTALDLARLNVKSHGLEHRIRCLQSDGFQSLQGQQYDLILLNPPYVGSDEMADLPAEYRHEPELALASGTDGLDLTRKLLREAANHLTASGVLFLEVGLSADALQDSFPDFPFLWLDFAQGGQGVTVLTHEECLHFKA